MVGLLRLDLGNLSIPLIRLMICNNRHLMLVYK
nr:MAG TPA: hypothetical protein [Caudoviricetes sp.]